MKETKTRDLKEIIGISYLDKMASGDFSDEMTNFYASSLLSFTSLLQATILMCLMYMFLFACVLTKCILCLVYMYLLFTSGPCSKCISSVINCFHVLLLCFLDSSMLLYCICM